LDTLGWNGPVCSEEFKINYDKIKTSIRDTPLCTLKGKELTAGLIHLGPSFHSLGNISDFL